MMKKPKIITEQYVSELISKCLRGYATKTLQARLDEVMQSKAKVYVTPEEIAELKRRYFVFCDCLKYEVGKFYSVGIMSGFTPAKITMLCVKASSRFATFEYLYKDENGLRKLRTKRSIRESIKTDWQTREAIYRRQCAYVNKRWSRVPLSYAHEFVMKPKCWDEVPAAVEVTASTEGGGCLDRHQMQELRGHIFEYLNAQLPKCIKEKGAAR